MKKILLTILTLILFVPFMINAEELKMEWQTSWGGNSWEKFSDILQTQDGGFIVYGSSESTDIEGLPNKGWSDAIIVKYDKDGNLLWQKSWGGNEEESFYDILQTQDGGFVVCAYSLSTDIVGLPNKGESDAIIVKYDKDGNLLWQNSWGGNDGEGFFDILQTQDGGFIVSGYSYSTDIEGLPNKGGEDAIIVKYDKDGNLLWQKSWGGNLRDGFSEILQTQDGGFIVSGYSQSTDIEELPNKGESDAIIIKYDKDGNVLWQKSWGGKSWEKFYDILETQEGGFVVCAYSLSTDIEGIENKGYEDAIIVKYDKDGNMLWQKSWGGNGDDDFNGILQTQDGGFIVCAYSLSTNIEGIENKGYEDAIIVKYDKDGNMLWQNSWGGNNEEEFTGILQTQDGGYIVYGASGSTDIEGKGSGDAIIVKYDKDGNLLWQKSWGGKFIGRIL